jgi:uncharacterized protein (TIGR03382 family)
MWLEPWRWLVQGAAGQPLGLDDEGEALRNDTPHGFDLEASASPPPALDAGFPARCALSGGVDRRGGPLSDDRLVWRVTVDGPDGRQEFATPGASLIARHGGRWHIHCLAAEVDAFGGDAYATATAETEVVWCPEGTHVEGDDCRCPAGMFSTDPGRIPCEPMPAGGATDGASTGAGCGCGTFDAPTALALLGLGFRRRRRP